MVGRISFDTNLYNLTETFLSWYISLTFTREEMYLERTFHISGWVCCRRRAGCIPRNTISCWNICRTRDILPHTRHPCVLQAIVSRFIWQMRFRAQDNNKFLLLPSSNISLKQVFRWKSLRPEYDHSSACSLFPNNSPEHSNSPAYVLLTVSYSFDKSVSPREKTNGKWKRARHKRRSEMSKYIVIQCTRESIPLPVHTTLVISMQPGCEVQEREIFWKGAQEFRLMRWQADVSVAMTDLSTIEGTILAPPQIKANSWKWRHWFFLVMTVSKEEKWFACHDVTQKGLFGSIMCSKSLLIC